MVCDLSEPGPVPDLLHVKDINVKIEEQINVLTSFPKKIDKKCSAQSDYSFMKKAGERTQKVRLKLLNI